MARFFNRFKRNTEFLQLSAVGNQGIVSLIGLARSIIVIRLLAPEEYGIIGIATAIGSSFSIFQNLGLGVGVAKEAAQTSDPGKLGLVSLTVLAVRLAMLAPLLALLVLVGAPQAVVTYQIPQLKMLIWLYAVFVLVSSPGDILGYVLTGSSRFRPYFFLRLFNEVLVTVAVCTMISRWHVTGYFIGQALAGGIYTFVSLIVVKRCVGRIEWAPWAEIRTLLKSVFRTSVSVYFAKLARGFSLQIPVLVAGLYLPLAAVGWLKFGMQAGGYAATVISAAQVVTLPRMTNYLKQYGPEYLFKRFGDNFRRLSSIIGCILIGAVAAAPELIRLVGTDRFVGSFKPFQLIIAFYVFIVLADSIFSGIHFPLNREASYVFSYLVYFALAVAVSSLSVVLLKTPESAAFGLVLGAMFHYAIAIFQTRRYPTLFTVLVKSCWKMLVVIIVATTLFFMEVLIQRYVLSVIGILFLALELSKNDPGIRHKISQITSNLKLR